MDPKMNPGNCGTNNWRDELNRVVEGKKVVWRTNEQQHPWIQLDLKEEMSVIKGSESWAELSGVMSCRGEV